MRRKDIIPQKRTKDITNKNRGLGNGRQTFREPFDKGDMQENQLTAGRKISVLGWKEA